MMTETELKQKTILEHIIDLNIEAIGNPDVPIEQRIALVNILNQTADIEKQAAEQDRQETKQLRLF